MMLQITNLFLYKIIFMVNLIFAQVMFLRRLDHKPNFAARLVVCNLVCLGFALLFPILYYNALYTSFMFFLFFLLTLAMAKFSHNISWASCLFCSIAGYSVQHIASVCYDIILTVSGLDNTLQFYSNDSVGSLKPLNLLIMAQVYVLVYWIFYQLYAKKIRQNEDVGVRSPSLLLLLAVMAMVQIVFNAITIYRKYENLDIVYYTVASVSNVLCTIFILNMLFGTLMRKTLENELMIVNQMWSQEKKQFKITKETIDLINIKCHDLKHQIRSIGQSSTIDPAALREMEQAITIYDAIVKTGNPTLDIILAEKSLYCGKNSINISYMIDGERLDFMQESDIYSLFGNLLDNAIEAVMKLEPDKRSIGITIKAEGELLSVNSHNYYASEVHMENGLPITSSGDRDYHGFGVKSMAMIVEKYGGNIHFAAKNHVFNCNILFPLASRQAC